MRSSPLASDGWPRHSRRPACSRRRSGWSPLSSTGASRWWSLSSARSPLAARTCRWSPTSQPRGCARLRRRRRPPSRSSRPRRWRRSSLRPTGTTPRRTQSSSSTPLAGSPPPQGSPLSRFTSRAGWRVPPRARARCKRERTTSCTSCTRRERRGSPRASWWSTGLCSCAPPGSSPPTGSESATWSRSRRSSSLASPSGSSGGPSRRGRPSPSRRRPSCARPPSSQTPSSPPARPSPSSSRPTSTRSSRRSPRRAGLRPGCGAAGEALACAPPFASAAASNCARLSAAARRCPRPLWAASTRRCAGRRRSTTCTARPRGR
mmetsp:Transcript_10597/g.31292  ORF Transcript_10597/g.31292 Transcript_10597/m.31292 type:complete len:320 (-) Transcript_10597:2079-3038(-)